MDQKVGTDLTTLNLRLLDSGRTLLIGALGGSLAILFYKTCELFVRGFMGGSFQLAASEQVSTALLIVVIAVLISLVPSSRRETERLRKENDESLGKLREELEKVARERA